MPVAGAMVSALGATTAFAVSDRAGRFEIRSLSPGPYLVRAHLTGFVAPRGQVIDVRASGARPRRRSHLRHASSVTEAVSSYPVLAAGVGAPTAPPSETEGTTGAVVPPDTTPDTAKTPTDDHSEIAWRLRHARRAILKDVEIPDDLFTEDPAADTRSFDRPSLFAVDGLSRLATNFFATSPFSGQVNLLTTSSFDSPQQLFSADNFAHSTAYLALGAPVGAHADWTARAALTQGDIASWIVAGEYMTRAPARHRYDVGLAYSTQRYEGGNFAALRDVTDGSRNAGSLYAFDTFAVTPVLTLTYGGALLALRLPRGPQPCQPARRADDRARATLPHQHDALEPRGRAGRRRVHAAASTTASGCRRSAPSRRSSPAIRSRPNAPTTWRSRSSATSPRPRCRCGRSASTSRTSW